MSFQDRDLSAPPPIWPTLIKVRRTLGVGPTQMAELMCLTRAEYEKFAKDMTEPPARALLELCRVLHVSFDQLMTNQFCYRTMARHFYGDTVSIPEKYTIAGKSKRRVLANLLDFVEMASDYQRRLELMRYLQVNDAALADCDGTVNLRCTMDAVAWLGYYSQNDEMLKLLGREMLLSPQNAPAYSGLKHCRSIYELLEALMFERGILYTHFEKNFLWKIHKIIPGKKVIVRGYVSPEVREQVGDELVRSRGGVLGRIGMASAMPEIVGWESVPAAIRDFLDKSGGYYQVEFDISRIITTSPRMSLGLVH